MEIIVINLTRMGDVVQSTPLLAGLKGRYKGCRITYLANKPYAEICKAIPFIDNLLTFDMEGYQSSLLSDKTTLVGGYRALENFLKEIDKREYDLLINLTPSRTCAILTSLIRAGEVRGMTIDKEGHRVIKGQWMRYLSTSVFNRPLNPFNLVDMYSRTGGVGGEGQGLRLDVPPPYDERAARLLEEAGIEDGGMIVGFQPGASKDHKRWSVQQFAVLGKMVADRLGARVLIFGSEGEKALGREIKGVVGDGAVDLVGKTTLMELAALLKMCTVLVTNDSGTMHIAAAVGTKVIELSLGAAYFRETGPYGEGHIVVEADIPCHPCGFHIECGEMLCREYITPESVYGVVEMVIDYADGRSAGKADSWKGSKVYRSGFDAEGFMEYTPVATDTVSKREIFLGIYKMVWPAVFEGHGVDYLRRAYGEAFGMPPVELPKELKAALFEDIVSAKRLIELAEDGVAKAKEVESVFMNSPDNLKRLNELDEEILLLDSEIEKVGFLVPELKPLTDIFKYGKEGLEGCDILSLARGTCALYGDLRTQGAILLDLLERAVCFAGDCCGDGYGDAVSMEDKSFVSRTRPI